MKCNVNRRYLNPGSSQTRRDFARRLAQLLAFGGLSHFAIKNTAKAATSEDEAHGDCPGGLMPYDICSSSDSDYCPGEKPPADECGSLGEFELDKCNSGISEADECWPYVSGSDQCGTGLPKDDYCPGNRPSIDGETTGNDVCFTGRLPDDECAASGSDAAGDQCPGGSIVEDTCSPEGSGKGNGDECSDGDYGSEDDCKNDNPDTCIGFELFDDDSCPNQKNAGFGENRYDDYCTGGFLGSDSCSTGTNEDDLCEGRGDKGQSDSCPEGKRNLDVCNAEISDDYCLTGVFDSDECPTYVFPEDECSGGSVQEDECLKHTVGSDVCTEVVSGSDQDGCKSAFTDECLTGDICTLNPQNDIIE